MIYYKELLDKLDCFDWEIINTNKKQSFYNIPCGFDIETSSTTLGGEKFAFSYIWMIGFGHNNDVYYGRTLDEFFDLCERLSFSLGLNKNKKLVVYVHNLGYEFQFIRKYFEWEKVFSIDDRKPLKAVTTSGIEFRCSYLLSGYSLANTAKNLSKHKVEKMVGDLDYSLIRHHETPLTPDELKYCENDIKVVTAYIDEQISIYGDITKIPATNTGRVRKYVKDACYFTSTNHKKTNKGKFMRYSSIMRDLTITPDDYKQLKKTFMGGFTHANSNYVGKTLKGVSSYDFTSSYPSVMVSEKFPMSKFMEIEITSMEKFNEYRSEKALIFIAKFEKIEPIIHHENYISESKCLSMVKPVINNGRVLMADELSICLTEIDFSIIEQCYKWESISISNVKYAEKGYLPKPIIESVLNLYQDKTVLKDVIGSEVEYLLSKCMLNSIYGMSVTDPVKDTITYDGEWGLEYVNVEEMITKYNTSKNRFLFYGWGVYITAFARRNLWTGIIAVGNDYVYSDTDSIKILNHEKYKKYFEWFDNQIISKMGKVCDYYKLDKKLLNPKTKKGDEKMLGIWDYEGTYNNFKTLGAKRYLVDDGKLALTVAGLSKQNGIKYMLKICNGDVDDVFNMFNDNLYIPSDETGKMTHTYIDADATHKIKDYLGNAKMIYSPSSIHLEPCEFTLSLSEQFNKFLQQLSKGYFYTGIKEI